MDPEAVAVITRCDESVILGSSAADSVAPELDCGSEILVSGFELSRTEVTLRIPVDTGAPLTHVFVRDLNAIGRGVCACLWAADLFLCARYCLAEVLVSDILEIFRIVVTPHHRVIRFTAAFAPDKV
jgi:hypothetical protein